MTMVPSRIAYPTVLLGAVALAGALLSAGVGPGVTSAMAYLAAIAAVTALERFAPHVPAWSPPWRERGQDAAYLGLGVAVQAAARGISHLGGALIAIGLAGWLGARPWPTGWPLAAQIALAVGLSDLGKYWLHRLAHERPWLWRFHAAHHAPRAMYALNAIRLHPVNALWNLVLDAVVPLMLGLDGTAIALLAAGRGAVAVLQHANVTLRTGPLDWILSTPALHQWHHSTRLEEANTNYSSTLIVWDIVFGTRRLPRDRYAPEALGLADDARHPSSLWGQLTEPWRGRARWRQALAFAIIALVVGGPRAVTALAPAVVEARLNHTLAAVAHPASPRARGLHAQLTVVDLHADSLLWGRDLLARSDRGHVDVPRLVEGNVALQAFTIVTRTPRGQNIDANADDSDNIALLAIAEGWPPPTWTDLTARALWQTAKLDDLARRSAGTLTVIHTASELDAYLARRARTPGITAGLLGVEGAQALGGRLANVDVLFAAGVRMMAPTHFTDNDVGGSASGLGQTGLTDLGRAVVRRMEALGMIVDLAHASPQTIDDVLAIATRPVVVSHTGVRGTCDNTRNLSDDQLTRIARTGGVVGIGYWGHAVCEISAASIAKAIRYAVGIVGVDHVALGSDFDGTTTTPFDASGVVAVTDALLADGFDDAAIIQIMGKNSLRVLRQGLPP